MEIELLGPLVVTRDDRPLGWAGPSPGCCSRCSPSTRAEWSGSTAWSTGSGERTCRPRRHCRWGRRARLRAAPGGAGLVARGRAGRLSRRPRGARRRHPPRGAAPGGAGGSRRGRPRARPASPGDRGAPGAGRAGAPTRAPARPAHASPVRDRPTGRRARRLPARPRGPGRARRPGPRPRAAPPGSPAPRPGPGAGDRSGTVGRRASGHPPRRPGGQGAGRRPTGAWRGGGRDRTGAGRHRGGGAVEPAGAADQLRRAGGGDRPGAGAARAGAAGDAGRAGRGRQDPAGARGGHAAAGRRRGRAGRRLAGGVGVAAGPGAAARGGARRGQSPGGAGQAGGAGRRRRGRRRDPAATARAGQPPPAGDPRQLRAPGGGGRQPGRDDPRRLPGSARAGDQPRGAARARRAAPAHAGAADAAGGPGRPGGAARLRRRPAVRGARPRGGPEPGAGRVPGAGDRRDLPGVDSSWELLTPPEQVALRRLAVFSGGCTLAAAERVCAGPGSSGWSCRRCRRRRPGSRATGCWKRCAYAGERLAEAGEADQVARSHAAWCVSEVDQSQTKLRGADQLVWWTRAHAEHANLRAGLRWLLDRGDAAGAVPLAGGLAWHQGFFGQRAEALSDLRAALALPGGPRDRARAEAVATLAWLGTWAGDGVEAFGARVAEAEAIFREVGEQTHADLIAALGHNLRERMRERERGGLPTSESSPSPARFDAPALEAVLAEDGWTHANAWYAMVSVMTVALERANDGDLAGARRDAEALLERMRRHGDRLGMIDCHELLFGIALLGGDLGQAEAQLRESLRLACELRYPAEMAVQLSRLGEVELGHGDLAGARAHLEQALAAFRQFGLPDVAASVGNGLGMVAALEGDLVRAAAEHDAALAAYRQLGDELGVAASEVLLGLVAAREGAPRLDHARVTVSRNGAHRGYVAGVRGGRSPATVGATVRHRADRLLNPGCQVLQRPDSQAAGVTGGRARTWPRPPARPGRTGWR